MEPTAIAGKLPLGTERRGLHLKPPHGELIADGRKAAIAKPKAFDLSGPWILVSKGLAYGTIVVGAPRHVQGHEFGLYFPVHRVTVSERRKWWPTVKDFYLSPVVDFTPFPEPCPVVVTPGMQTVLETVTFVGQEPVGLDDHCAQVRALLATKAAKETPVPVGCCGNTTKSACEPCTCAQQGAPGAALLQLPNLESSAPQAEISSESAQKGLQTMPEDTDVDPGAVVDGPVRLETNQPAGPTVLSVLVSSIHKSFTIAADQLFGLGYLTQNERIALSSAIGDGLGRFNDALQEHGLTDTVLTRAVDMPHAELIATKAQEGNMPYDPKSPPDKLRAMPEHAQRIWVEAFNACFDERQDETKCHKIAYGAVHNAGYYEDEDGTWHAREKGEEEDEEKKPKDEAGCTKAEPTDAEEQIVLEQGDSVKPVHECTCPKCDKVEQVLESKPCTDVKCPDCGVPLVDKDSKPDEKQAGLLDWLKALFAGHKKEIVVDPAEWRRAFKAFTASDGKPWLLTWTTNAFQDREGEIFTTKAIEQYVSRHTKDTNKGEFWFWHLPGAKFGTIKWQGVVGRFLAEAGPFDETPVGRKMAEFFRQYPHNHPELAPEGWGTSHGYFYAPPDLADKAYSWFEKFETTVLPRVAAANQHSPQMEVLPMNEQQKAALSAIGGDDLVTLVERTGEERTKDLEAQGISFKQEAAPVAAPVVQEIAPAAAPVVAEVKVTLPAAVPAQESGAAGQKEGAQIVDPAAKEMSALAQSIVAGLNLGELVTAIKEQQASLKTALEILASQETRLKALENVSASPAAPMPRLPMATWLNAGKAAQAETAENKAVSQPSVPTAIVQMARRIPA